MTEHTFSFQYEARYFKLGSIDSATQSVWFVLHGYGQLAKYFLKKFSVLESSNTCIIAPEGLSRFYLEDVATRTQSGNQRVGATWMTRENREAEINNYIRYLNTVFDSEIPKGFTGKINLLGFSQGAATVTRWAMAEKIRFDRLLLWGGIFPPDMNFERGAELLKNKQVIEIVGRNDPFLNDERMKEITALNQRLNINPQLIMFEGGHEIDPATLSKLA